MPKCRASTCDPPGQGHRRHSPACPPVSTTRELVDAQRVLLDCLIGQLGIERLLLWYYTPMSLAFSDHLARAITVYDCMDDLTGFLGAPRQLQSMERRLLSCADVVFTGGRSLFDVKRKLHGNVHAFPSSVDAEHFRTARGKLVEPLDQRAIPHPRLGFCGVIDERLDLGLLSELAALRPDWHLVLLGPVVKIDPQALPRAANIHYLGGKKYDELPLYIASWDVALMPFAINRATRFISPTKTPEYLAAGRPVVSTPIADVVRDYGHKGLVAIAEDAAGFAAKIGQILADRESADAARRERLARPGRRGARQLVPGTRPGRAWCRRIDEALHRRAVPPERPSRRPFRCRSGGAPSTT
jgi:glycosyltransferase involved in cell wall biosynthesis